MKVITFPDGQGSEAWLKWRNGGIGASDIPVITGTSRFKTPLQLWNEKCGYKEKTHMNAAMRFGHEREIMARHWLNVNLGLNLAPICIEDDEESIFRASLDGYDFERKVLVEIKSPISSEIIENARLKQSVPEEYIDQNQWQIALANPKRSIIAIWDENAQGCITIENFCMPERQEDLKKRAKEFWHKVVMGTPPESQKQDYIVIETPELEEKLKEYGRMDEQERTAKSRKKELKEEIIKCGDGNFLSYGYRITWCTPKATYNIDQMKLDGIDVEKYLKPHTSSGFYKINTPGSHSKKQRLKK